MTSLFRFWNQIWKLLENQQRTFCESSFANYVNFSVLLNKPHLKIQVFCTDQMFLTTKKKHFVIMEKTTSCLNASKELITICILTKQCNMLRISMRRWIKSARFFRQLGLVILQICFYCLFGSKTKKNIFWHLHKSFLLDETKWLQMMQLDMISTK